MLAKDKFIWTEETIQSFERLKQAKVSLPVLDFPNFLKSFSIETDTSEIAIDTILHHESHSITYFSKKSNPTMKKASTYAGELFVITKDVKNGDSTC